MCHSIIIILIIINKIKIDLEYTFLNKVMKKTNINNIGTAMLNKKYRK